MGQDQIWGSDSNDTPTGGPVTTTSISGNKRAVDTSDSSAQTILTNTYNRTAKPSDTVEAVRTSITAGTTSKINVPDDAEHVIIYHLESGEYIYIGKDASITSSSNSAAIESGYRVNLLLAKGNDNNLYATASSGTITVYAIGVYRE